MPGLKVETENDPVLSYGAVILTDMVIYFIFSYIPLTAYGSSYSSTFVFGDGERI